MRKFGSAVFRYRVSPAKRYDQCIYIKFRVPAGPGTDSSHVFGAQVYETGIFFRLWDLVVSPVRRSDATGYKTEEWEFSYLGEILLSLRAKRQTHRDPRLKAPISIVIVL